MGKVMDATFAGLASPRRVFHVGRPDLDPSDRPGAFLIAAVERAARAGGLEYEAAPAHDGHFPFILATDEPAARRIVRACDDFDNDITLD